MAMSMEEFNKRFGGEDQAYKLPDVKKTRVGEFVTGVGAGLKKGAQLVGSGINEYNKIFYDKTGLEDFTNYEPQYQKSKQKLEQFDTKINTKLVEKLGVDGAQSYATQAGMGVGQAIGQVGVSLIPTVGPTLAYTTIAAQAVGSGKEAYDDAYAGAKKNGLSDEEAKRIAKINGIITGAVNVAEAVPLAKTMSLGKDLITKPLQMGATEVAKRFGTAALLESGTEGAQDFVSSLTAKLTYDKTREPIREGIHSALVALPSSLLFGGFGEVNIQRQIKKSKDDITGILVQNGMDPEKAALAADLMVKQQMVSGKDSNVFEETPKELKEAYDNAVEYKNAQFEMIANDPNYRIDTRLSDTADGIISAYKNYEQTSTKTQTEQDSVLNEEMDITTNEVLDTIPDDNLLEAEKEWMDTTGKEYAKLQSKIQKEERKLKLAQQKEQFLNEPYTPEAQLPTIEMGKGPKDTSGLPTIQTEVSKQRKTAGDFTYEPIINKIDSLLEQQDNLVTQFKEKHTKPKEIENITKKIETLKEEQKGLPEKPIEKVEQKIGITKEVVVPEEGVVTKEKKITTKETDEMTPVEQNDGEQIKSRAFERLQEENDTLEGDVLYTKANQEKDIDKAFEILSQDKQKAYDIALGRETSSDVTSTAMNIVMAEKAREEGNLDLFFKLTRNRSLAQTRRGQEISAEKGSVTDNSTAKYVRDLIVMKLEVLGENYLGDLKETLKKSTRKQRGQQALQNEVDKEFKRVKSGKLDMDSALKLLDKLTCL